MTKKKETESLSQEMIDNIQAYSNKIETIEDYVAAVRQTIGYHIGSAGTKGHIALIREIAQNGFDEAIKVDSPCNYVRLEFDERNLQAIVTDNGRGIPFDKLVNVFSAAYTSSNYTKAENEYSSGINGSGAKICMALSSYFRAESYILGKAMYIEAIEGHLTTKEPIPIKNPEIQQGTRVTFIPSFEAMGEMHTTCEDIYDLFFTLFPLLPIGTTVEFVGIDKDGKIKYNETRVNQDGIVAHLIDSTTSPLIAPVMFMDDNGTTKAEIAFTYDTSDLGSEMIASYSNFCITIGGTHKDGFIDGICTYFRNYMNKIYLGEKSKVIIVNNDIKTGLRAIVNAAHLHPTFNAQAKEILTNEDMYYFVKNLTMRSLDDWVKTNPGPLQKLCKFYKDVAESRMKSDEAKIKISTKYQTSLVTGKPKKYVPASGKEHLELIIVEGDSACGSAKLSRDSTHQAIFPIRGKIPNACDTTKVKFLGNEEIASIITIIGGGYGKSFDISKVPFEKVIIMSDADPTK